MNFFKQILCSHLYRAITTLKGEFSPCMLLQCLHCGKRKKIDAIDSPDSILDHQLLNDWLKGKDTLGDLKEIIK